MVATFIALASAREPEWFRPCMSNQRPCEENAATPTPRTTATAKSKNQYDLWFDFQKHLAAEAARGESLDILFVGDSITEGFNGSSYGVPSERAAGVPKIFADAFAHLRTLVLAISGDQTQHVLWRLGAGGEMNAWGVNGEPKAALLLIGTNNLAYGHTPKETSAGIAQVALLMSERLPSTEVFVSKLLPRGGSLALTQLVVETNQLLEHLRGSFGKRTHLIDCSITLLAGGHEVTGVPIEAARWAKDWVVDNSLMPDLLHPNAEGYKRWLMCVKTAMGQSQSRNWSALDALRLIATFSAISMFLALCPVASKIQRERNVGAISPLQFAATALNCAIFSTYGALLRDWVPMVAANSVGVITGSYALFIFRVYAMKSSARTYASALGISLFVAMVILVAMATTAWEDQALTQVFLYLLGKIGVCVCIAMFASPLDTINQVCQSRSTAPLSPLSTTMTIMCTTSWGAYGFICADFNIWGPNSVGFLLSCVQVILFARFGLPPSAHSTSQDKTPKAWSRDPAATGFGHPQDLGAVPLE